MTKSDFSAFLTSNLGNDLTKSSLAKTRDLARLLYKGYVASTYSKFRPFYLVLKLKNDIDDFINDTIKLNKKYGVFYDTIDYNLAAKNIDKHIEETSNPNYKSILAELNDVTEDEESSEPKKVKKTKVTKLKAKKVKKTLAKNKSKVKNKTKVKKAKECKSYKVSELKEMAATLKVRGYLRMNKDELCKSLGI